MWLASSFVSLRLDSVSLYFRISFVFQTDSLYQFLFKACPPSGVRGLLTSLFITCLSCYDLALYLLSFTFNNWHFWYYWHCSFLKNFLHRCPVIKPLYRTIFVKPRKLSLSKSTSVLLNFLYRKAKRGLPFKKSK